MKLLTIRFLDRPAKKEFVRIVNDHQERYQLRSAAAAVEDIVERYEREIKNLKSNQKEMYEEILILKNENLVLQNQVNTFSMHKANFKNALNSFLD